MKLKIYTINGSKYSAKNMCNTMIIVPRRHKDPPSGGHRPSDMDGTVNSNAELNLSLIYLKLTP